MAIIRFLLFVVMSIVFVVVGSFYFGWAFALPCLLGFAVSFFWPQPQPDPAPGGIGGASVKDVSPMTCPSWQVLTDLALGKLPWPAIDSLGAHVEGCTACQHAFQDLDRLEDPLLVAIKNTLPTATEIGPELERRLQGAERISATVWRSETADQIVESPSPSSRPPFWRQGLRRWLTWGLVFLVGTAGLPACWSAQTDRAQELNEVEVVGATEGSQLDNVEPSFARFALRDEGGIDAQLSSNVHLGQSGLLASFAKGLDEPLIGPRVLGFLHQPPPFLVAAT